MRRTVTPCRAALAAALLLLAAAPTRGQDKDKAAPATLVVELPTADARLEVDGESTRQNGTTRRFVSPPLKPGVRYHYLFQVWFWEDHKMIVRKRSVPVRAGETTTVDLRKSAPGDVTPDVIYVPTPRAVVDKMLRMAEVKKGDVVYDLGCGDGRIVVTAAKKYGCKSVGFDIDPDRVKEANANVRKDGVGDLVTIKQEDIFKQDLSKASVVTLYLLPELNVRLIPQLEKLKPGSRIVSHDFPMKGVKPKQVFNMSGDDGREHTIYLWVTPLEKEKP
ncbi:MAG TPA: TIGR03000 domain-containing protein [Gemmataceae bacterium]|jgi:uncharacterized protein (TIGR03000 family)|nr:TIGR03000 domain-containing protein [Gemmataceae bacterium]